jgi:hypothetical protein
MFGWLEPIHLEQVEGVGSPIRNQSEARKTGLSVLIGGDRSTGILLANPGW